MLFLESITLRFTIANGNPILSGVAIAYASLMRQAQRVKIVVSSTSPRRF